ncbi:zinc finger protein 26-like [Dreissena polymorpha]|uniref:C2H2-type domain-containing protein n=1 Tax=Dreissena polymorpha TaxID=45954 RepID=A0A9D4G7R8_DREPO|nr:zinc finger protein 26-like [Dreissena polymorpha]XP_052217190.1 zinc finger protein 26-like [Dreissena polymorpha]XP_052217191.1 zinc finger protein 26-like [Dreissena polymorpha]XP_052217192.1 zinc finger protein 26-like [Dreissena polymorpha]KAH3812033.1 hypothetical protein DPMN_140454 [Dreissena polymorpha]
MEDDDLDSFVEAVTTYRCKFCAFTATDTKEVSQHVRALHIPVKKILPDGTHTAGSIASNDLPLETMQNEVNHSTAKTFHETNNLNSQVETLDVPCNGQILSLLNSKNKDSVCTKSDTKESAAYVSIASGTAALSDSCEILPSVDNYSAAIENEHNANNQLITESDASQMIVENCGNVDVSSNRLVHVLVTNQQDLQNSEVGNTLDSSTQADPCKYIEEDPMYHFTSSRSQHVTNVKHTVANEVDPLTKELYLCGTCSEGFTSINDCKLHMTNIHGVTEFQMGNLPRKVDTGTQMEHKKRGRKKKSECIPKVEPIDADENADIESVDMPLSGSDEDWIESLQTYSTRSRRKRRPPPALKSDYYLGRTKKKEKKEETPSDVKPITGYRCDEKNCGAKFAEETLLEKHQEYHVKDPTPGANHFKCTSCDQTFAVWKAVKIHAWKSHNEDLGLFKCHYCSFRTDASSKLRIHMEIHGTDRPYVCAKCDKGFKQFAQLKNHEQTHLEREKVQHNIDDSRRICDVCSRVFASQKCMRIHREAVHSGHKPFKCSFCEHTCARKAMLILHQRTHTGEKPFKCNVCHYTCSDHNSLRRHRMRHTGLKPYKCPHCPYACIQAISLKVHIKNKHPDLGGIFCCSLCLYRTVNGQQYQNHLLDHKNGLLPIDADYVGAIEPPLSHSGLTLQPRRSRASYGRPVVKTSFSSTKLPGQENILGFVQHTNTVSGGQHVLHIPVSATSGEEHLAQLQIQLNENSEALISAEEYEKIVDYEGSESQSEINATNLIYSALSAISMQSNDQMDLGMEPHDLVSKIQNGDIQTSIETNFNKDGVTTHTITFRLPDGGELLGGVTLQESSEEKEAVDVLEANTSGSEWQIVNDQTSIEFIDAGS